MTAGAEDMLVGVDIDSSRVLAVSGASGLPPQVVRLDGADHRLPMAVSLAGRSPQVGRQGSQLCRRLPHLVCLDFLAELGKASNWRAGKHRLSAVDALALVLERVACACAAHQGLTLALPFYLDRRQLGILTSLAEAMGKQRHTRLPPLLGTVPTPLAVALSAYAEQPWTGLALVVDVDEHALTLSWVNVAGDQAQALEAHTFRQLGLRTWKERLLNVAADDCVRQSRRDPRDSADAEQFLYDQFDDALEHCRQGRVAELTIHTPSWSQNLIWRPEEIAGFCSALLGQFNQVVEKTLAAMASHGQPNTILVTASAGRLPGLVEALEEYVGEARHAEHDDEEDFGINLFGKEDAVRSGVCVVSADAAARAAYGLAGAFQSGELPGGHIHAATLPSPLQVDTGPVRLLFRNQEYIIYGLPFTLGRKRSSNLVFDSEFPGVSARHCEIIFENGAFVLCDHSRNGTFVNDRLVHRKVVLRPGDWIRLGPEGPVLRFLGHADTQQLTTTA